MSRQPDPWKSLRDEFRKLQEQIRRMQAASPFFGTGFHPNGAGGMDSDNFVAGESGYSFKADGNAEFNDITLRGGIIGNDALSSPVFPGVYHAEASDFTVSPTMTSKASITVTPPAGYTRAMVSAVASASAFNPTATSDYLYVAAWIQNDTTIGYAMPTTCPASQSASTTQGASALLTGISGPFTIKAAVSTGFVSYTTSVTGNVCNIDATVLFLR